MGDKNELEQSQGPRAAVNWPSLRRYREQADGISGRMPLAPEVEYCLPQLLGPSGPGVSSGGMLPRDSDGEGLGVAGPAEGVAARGGRPLQVAKLLLEQLQSGQKRVLLSL